MPSEDIVLTGLFFVSALLYSSVGHAGAHGYTLFPVEGVGAQGSRVADIEEFANIQIEVIQPPDPALQLQARLEKEFFTRFAMVAYSTDIEVIRSEKF